MPLLPLLTGHTKSFYIKKYIRQDVKAEKKALGEKESFLGKPFALDTTEKDAKKAVPEGMKPKAVPEGSHQGNAKMLVELDPGTLYNTSLSPTTSFSSGLPKLKPKEEGMDLKMSIGLHKLVEKWITQSGEPSKEGLKKDLAESGIRSKETAIRYIENRIKSIEGSLKKVEPQIAAQERAFKNLPPQKLNGPNNLEEVLKDDKNWIEMKNKEVPRLLSVLHSLEQIVP